MFSIQYTVLYNIMEVLSFPFTSLSFLLLYTKNEKRKQRIALLNYLSFIRHIYWINII